MKKRSSDENVYTVLFNLNIAFSYLKALGIDIKLEITTFRIISSDIYYTNIELIGKIRFTIINVVFDAEWVITVIYISFVWRRIFS